VATQLEIVNKALARLGIKKPLTALTDDRAEATQASNFWTPTVKELLELFDWPWAAKYAVLSESTTALSTDVWGYTYDLPADCVAARLIYTGTRVPNSEERIPYDLEWNDDDSITSLRCDVAPVADESPLLRYTVDFSSSANAAKFPPLFADAVAWTIARELAVPLEVDARLAEITMVKADLALSRAIAASLRQRQEDGSPDGSTASSRL